ncbi:antibiotic biosynthesis monooxygenase family protein [Streptomyces sp. I05A-00742]|uniref:antibiotic biosynthesis monooxygenase family protein n=1 Tax=Streptomyces sp. I05A-00742 TaxID=2732853 RepID=UPI0014895F2F|nr:antibiotic biosynthesis monooxygenase family protein [Streptomyces sp. I05A-00742]
MKLQDHDPTTPFLAQLQERTGPVTLVNTFVVPEEAAERFEKTWREDAGFMKAQPGFISTQLYRGTAGSRLWLNVAVWESTDALRAAFGRPEFQQARAKYSDAITAAPHVYTKVAVEGICVA